PEREVAALAAPGLESEVPLVPGLVDADVARTERQRRRAVVGQDRELLAGRDGVDRTLPAVVLHHVELRDEGRGLGRPARPLGEVVDVILDELVFPAARICGATGQLSGPPWPRVA